MDFSLILHGPEKHCTCLTNSEKRKACLLCCATIDTACPTHTGKRSKDIRKYGHGVVEPDQDQSISWLQRLKKLLFNAERKEKQLSNALQEHEEKSVAKKKDTGLDIRKQSDVKDKVRDKTDDAFIGLDTSKQNSNNDKLRDNIDIMMSEAIKENASCREICSTGTESSSVEATQPFRDRKGNRRKKQPDSTHGVLIVKEYSNCSHEENMTMIAV